MSTVRGNVIRKVQYTVLDLILKIVIKTNNTANVNELIFLGICTTAEPDFGIVYCYYKYMYN